MTLEKKAVLFIDRVIAIMFSLATMIKVFRKYVVVSSIKCMGFII